MYLIYTMKNNIMSLKSDCHPNELAEINTKIREHSLILTQADYNYIVCSLKETLDRIGVVELSTYVRKKIITCLAASPYSPLDFKEEVSLLLDGFYTLRSVFPTPEDDEIIETLFNLYNSLGGSASLASEATNEEFSQKYPKVDENEF